MVFNQRGQSTRNLGQYRGEDVGGIRRKRMSIHFAATQETIETIFRIIVSAN